MASSGVRSVSAANSACQRSREREPLRPAGLGRVGPAAVVAVVADGGRGDRVEPKDSSRNARTRRRSRSRPETPIALRSSRSPRRGRRRLDPDDRAAAIVGVEDGRLARRSGGRCAGWSGRTDVRHARGPAELEAAVRELVLATDDRHPRLAPMCTSLLSVAAEREREPAVLPDEPDRREQHAPVLADRGKGRQVGLVEQAVAAARRSGRGSRRHRSGARRLPSAACQRRRGWSRSSSRDRASAWSRWRRRPPRRPARGRLRRARSGAGRSWAPQDEAGLRRWVETALANQEAGTERPFATIDLASGRAIGSSRYMSIVPEHKRLEIGWTWVGVGVPAQRRQPRGEAAPADPRVRDARRQPGRVQDARPQRAIAHRPRGDRRDVRGRLPPAT